MSTTPEVVIVTPFKDAGSFVTQFISSMKLQTYDSWLCILVNDGHDDDSYIRRCIARDSRFKLIGSGGEESSKGPGFSRNVGIGFTKSRFIAFCDIDDIWHPEKLSQQVEFHKVNNLQLSVTTYARFSLNSAGVRILSIVRPPKRIGKRSFYGPNPIPMLTALVNREIVQEEFESTRHEDLLFWMRTVNQINAEELRYGCLDECLAGYRVHDNNLTRSKVLMPLWTYNVFRKAGLSKFRAGLAISTWALGHAFNYIKKMKSSTREYKDLKVYLDNIVGER